MPIGHFNLLIVSLVGGISEAIFIGLSRYCHFRASSCAPKNYIKFNIGNIVVVQFHDCFVVVVVSYFV